MQPAVRRTVLCQQEFCLMFTDAAFAGDPADSTARIARLRKAGYKYRAAAENTGRGFGTPQRAVDWWMNSPKHRTNILYPKMREVGIGIAMSDAPDSKLHWVINFGVSR